MTPDAALILLIDSKLVDDIGSDKSNQAAVVRYCKSTNANGISSHRTLHAILRISKYSLLRLFDEYNNPFSKKKISALYTLGLAVPENKECSNFWNSTAYNFCECDVANYYLNKFKNHIKKAITESYYLYTTSVTKQNRLLKEESGNIICVYKNTVTGYKLHNIIYQRYCIIHNINLSKVCNIEFKTNIKNVNSVVVHGTLSFKKRNSQNLDDAIKTLVSETETEKFARSLSKTVKFVQNAVTYYN